MIVPKGGNFIVLKEDELAHYGVLGMKWGVRRYQNKDGSLTAEGKKRRENSGKSEAQKSTERSKRRDLKNRGTLTDDEIRAKINRLRLEKELRTLTEEELSPGKTAMRNAAKQAASQVATTAMAGALRYSMVAAANRKFNMGEMLKSMATGNVEKEKTSLDKLKEAVTAMTLQKQYSKLEVELGRKEKSYFDKLKDEVAEMTLQKQYNTLKAEAEEAKKEKKD